MFINEIITCGNDELYMFLAVEIFVVEQSVNVYIYLCVYYKVWFGCVWMCMFFCVLVSKFFEPTKKIL